MKQQVEVFFHSQQPYTSVQEADLAPVPLRSSRLSQPVFRSSTGACVV